MDDPKLTQDKKSWLAGARHAFAQCERDASSVPDKLAYASGYIEGQAAREAGESLESFIARNRVWRGPS